MKVNGTGKGISVKPCVLWFTGLSGSGKSTIAEKLVADMEADGVELEYLDGDRVRDIFPNIGFSKAERNEHVRRIGFLASMLEKHGVFVVASFVSPYEDARNFVRDMCKNYVEVYVSTPLDECERRDVKGLYAKARAGEISNFTGISDPYEPPNNPEIEVDTANISLEDACAIVTEYLEKR